MAMGRASINRRLIARLTSEQTPTPTPREIPGLGELTDRERDVLLEIARGLPNAEIAEHMFLSEHTVKTHGNPIFSKLGLPDRAQAVGVAYLGPTWRRVHVRVAQARQPAESAEEKKPNTSGRGCGLWVDAWTTADGDRRKTHDGPVGSKATKGSSSPESDLRA